VVRGVFQILLLPAAAAAAQIRAAQVVANDPAVLLAARGRDVLAWLLAHTPHHEESDTTGNVMPWSQGHFEQEAARQVQLGDRGVVLKRMLALGRHGAALAHAFTGAELSLCM
jgi:hypothetical protein